MPYLAFASNFLWVLVIGLLGPSVPAILADLGIGYTQAGLFFTMLSLGSLFGTFLGRPGCRHGCPARPLFAGIALLMALGLSGRDCWRPPTAGSWPRSSCSACSGAPPGWWASRSCWTCSPSGAPSCFPLQTMFSSLGSLTAPLLVSANLRPPEQPGRWRWPFAQVAGLALLLFLGILLIRLPGGPAGPAAAGGRCVACWPARGCWWSAALIFFCVAPDLGFSFWLAEHFRTDLGVGLRLSSAVVSLYLLGMIGGRLATSRLVKVWPARRLVQGGLALTLASLAAFLAAPGSRSSWPPS